MFKQRKRIAAALISTTLILSNFASILPKGTVYASDGTTQEEQSQDEGLHEVYVPEEPIPAEEPAPVQAPAEENAGNEEASGEAAGAEAPADAQTAELSVNAEAAEQPAAAPEAGMDAAAASDAGLESDAAEQEGNAALIEGEEAAENSASASAESSEAAEVAPDAGAGESGEANAVTIYYIADEGGSVSVPSESVRAAEGGQASGSEAVAADGYTFTGWITLDGTVVCTDALFVPGVTPEMTGEVKYTAHFEKAEEAPATRMVTAEYAASKGGSVSRTSETLDALAEGAAFLGSTAAAEDGYAFVNWTAADGTEVSRDVTFVPAVGPDTAEKSVYTANFKKIITMPAQDFEGTAGSVHVNVHADEGNFPEGTRMNLRTVSTSSILNNDSVQDAVGKDREVVDAVAVDITFQDKDGNEIEPTGTISVRMTTSSRVEGKSHEVLHIDDNGNASAVTSASATGASFDAGEFSIYVITGIDTPDQSPAIATYVFYDAKGNEIAGSTQKVKNGETVYAPTTPEKPGSKFLGWSYTKGAIALQEDDPGNFKTLTASVTTTGRVALYPVFEEVYYVFFLDNQGRVSTTKEGASGNSISVSDVVIPLDSTQSVTGWYTDSELTEESKVKDSVKLTNHNVTLYPKVEKGHYLYFVSGEGASYVKPAFVAAEKETAAPEVPTRPGYTFLYWSEHDGGGAYTFGGKISVDTTLYAVWKPSSNTKYTIIYWWENANDGGYSYHKHEEKSGTTGSRIKIESISKTYEGFTLNEEKTSKANNGVTISGDGSTIVNIYYSRNQYTIRFYHSEWEGTWLYGSYQWYEMTSLRINAKYGANISDQWPTSTSKIWGTKKGYKGQGAAPYQSGISTMPLDGGKFYYVSQNGYYTMNLKYLLEDLNGQYVLDHTDSFKSDEHSWSTTAEDHYDIEGFSYTGNVNDGTRFSWNNGSRAYEVSFRYSRNSYSINFVNGDSKSSQTFKYGADISKVDLKTPPTRPLGTPKENKFAGWFDNELGAGNPVVLTGTMPAYNITLYAKWAAPTYKGTVHTNIEGTGKTIEILVDYGGTINENSMPSVVDADGNLIQEGTGNATVTVPANYSWVGWATKDGEDFTLYNFNTQLYSDITLYPYYINTAKFKVTYDLGKGSGTAPTDNREYAENSYADIMSASGITAPKEKTFLYWTDGSKAYYPGDKVKVTGNLELTAFYGDTAKKTSITYHSNYPKGSNLTDGTSVVEGQDNNTAITLPEAGFTAPKGYYFVGWNTAANGSGKTYTPGTDIGIDNTSENHLYAIWEEQKVITLIAKSAEATYDGTVHSVAGVDTDTFTFDGVEYKVSGFKTENPSAKDAGVYTNKIIGPFTVRKGTTDVTRQFVIHTEDGSLTIRKRSVTLTSASASKAYDGTALTRPDVTVTGDGFVAGEVSDLKASGTITMAGSVPNTIIYTKNTGFKADNYDINMTEGTLTITNNDVKITVTAGSESKKYDGTPLTKNTYSITGLPDGFTAVVTVSGSITDAGSTLNNVTSVAIKKDNETVTDQFTGIETVSGTLEVTKRTVKLTSQSASKPFDGKVLTKPEVTVGGDGFVDGEVSNITATGSILTAGSVTNTIVYSKLAGFKDKNYLIEKDEGTLTITQIENAIVVNARNAEKKYDGSPLTKNEADVTGLPEGYTADVTVSGSIKDAGTTANVVRAVVIRDESGNDVTAQFKTITKNNGTLTVTQRNVTLTSETVTREYDGTALTAPDVEVTGDGFVDGEVTDLKATGTITKVGSTANPIAYTEGTGFKAENYEITKSEGTLTITANTAVIKVTAGSSSRKYDGTALTKNDYSVIGLPDGFTVEAAVSGSITDAGSTPNEFTSVVIKKDGIDVTDQFSDITKKNGKLTVTKRSVTLVSESAEKKYDGKPLTAPSVRVEGDGFVNGEVNDLRATGTITEAGSTANTIEYTTGGKFREGNYEITKLEGILKITKNNASIKVTADSESKLYDGTPLTKGSYSVTGLPEGFTVEAVVSGSITDAGTAENEVTSVAIKKDGKDVTDQFSGITKESGTLTVNRRSVKLVSGSAQKKYDSKPLTAPSVRVEGDGFVDGEVSDIKATGSIKTEGSVTNTIVYTTLAGFKEKNYSIEKDEGTLTITKNDDEIVVNARNAAKMYDGTPLKETGADVTGLPEGFTAAVKTSGSITDVGNAPNVIDSVVISNEDGDEVTDQFSKITKNNGTLTVSQRSVILTSKTAEKEYDGTPLTASEVTVSGDGFVDGEVTDIKATGSITEVGSAPNEITYSEGEQFKEGNYKIELNPGTLTITKSGQKFVITSASAERKYDGTPLSASEVTVEKPVGLDSFTVEAVASGSITNAGETENTITSVVIKDAAGNNVTENFAESELHHGTLKVMKRELTLTSDSASKEYDGTPLTAHHVTIGGDGLAEGETAEFAFTGSQTEIGSSENRFTAKISRSIVENTKPAPVRRLMRLMAVLLPDDQDSTEHEDSQTGAPEDNYDITYVYGTLTVTAKAEPKPQPENPGGGGGTTTNTTTTTTTTVYQPVVEPKVLGASRVIPVQEPVQEAEQPPVVEQKVLGATRTGSAVPMTGDDSSMGFYGWIALIAAAGMMGWLAADRKRRKNH